MRLRTKHLFVCARRLSIASRAGRRTGSVRCSTEHRLSVGYSVAGFCVKDMLMHASLSLGPLVSLMAGVLILIVPRLLNYIVAIYLIVAGLLGLFGDIHFR